MLFCSLRVLVIFTIIIVSRCVRSVLRIVGSILRLSTCLVDAITLFLGHCKAIRDNVLQVSVMSLYSNADRVLVG